MIVIVNHGSGRLIFDGHALRIGVVERVCRVEELLAAHDERVVSEEADQHRHDQIVGARALAGIRDLLLPDCAVLRQFDDLKEDAHLLFEQRGNRSPSVGAEGDGGSVNPNLLVLDVVAREHGHLALVVVVGADSDKAAIGVEHHVIFQRRENTSVFERLRAAQKVVEPTGFAPEVRFGRPDDRRRIKARNEAAQRVSPHLDTRNICRHLFKVHILGTDDLKIKNKKKLVCSIGQMMKFGVFFSKRESVLATIWIRNGS